MFFSWLASVLAFGGLLSLLVVNPRDFGKGFHRFNGSLAGLFLAAGVAGGTLRGASGWAALIGCTLWVVLVQWGVLKSIRGWLLPPILLTAWALVSATPYNPREPVL